MRIALVNLRADTDNWPHIVMVPLGLMYLSSRLRQAFGRDVEIRLFDMTLMGRREDVAAGLRELQPEIVGIRGFTTQADEYPVLARIAKEAAPGCLVVAGGPHASTHSPTLSRVPDIDLVAPGEGEETLVAIVEALRTGRDPRSTSGVGWTEAGFPVWSEPRPLISDLDALPFPDYGILDLDRYQGLMTMTGFPSLGRYVSIFTSRGCHFRCVYCHDNFGKRVRWRSVENVLEEMAWLQENHAVCEFHIVDDIFNADKARALRIFDGIVRRGWKVRLAFPNGLRADIMDEEFIAAARAAGAYHWALAVESASPRLQKVMRKFNKLDRVFETIALADRLGVFTATFNMLGFPGETLDEMRATIDFNLASKAHQVHFFLAMPFEGTGLHEMVAQTETPVRSEGGGLGYSTIHGEDDRWFTEVPKVQVEALIVDAHRRFYFDAARIRRMLALSSEGHPPADVAELLRTRLHSTGSNLARLPDREAAALIQGLFERTSSEMGAHREQGPALAGAAAGC